MIMGILVIFIFLCISYFIFHEENEIGKIKDIIDKYDIENISYIKRHNYLHVEIFYTDEYGLETTQLFTFHKDDIVNIIKRKGKNEKYARLIEKLKEEWNNGSHCRK